MTREELVAALREYGNLFNLAECHAAAAMLEQDKIVMGNTFVLFNGAVEKRDALAAKVARLREALELMRSRFMDVDGSYGDWENEAIDAADAALGETA